MNKNNEQCPCCDDTGICEGADCDDLQACLTCGGSGRLRDDRMLIHADPMPSRKRIVMIGPKDDTTTTIISRFTEITDTLEAIAIRKPLMSDIVISTQSFEITPRYSPFVKETRRERRAKARENKKHNK